MWHEAGRRSFRLGCFLAVQCFTETFGELPCLGENKTEKEMTKYQQSRIVVSLQPLVQSVVVRVKSYFNFLSFEFCGCFIFLTRLNIGTWQKFRFQFPYFWGFFFVCREDTEVFVFEKRERRGRRRKPPKLATNSRQTSESWRQKRKGIKNCWTFSTENKESSSIVWKTWKFISNPVHNFGGYIKLNALCRLCYSCGRSEKKRGYKWKIIICNATQRYLASTSPLCIALSRCAFFIAGPVITFYRLMMMVS